MTEMHKTKNELNPLFMQEIFLENKTRYILRYKEFIQSRVRSVCNETESVRFKGLNMWQTLPPTIRNSETLFQFEKKSKTGTAKTVLASYATYLFLTWAIYDFWISALNCIF